MSTIITPDQLPVASDTQRGIVMLADDASETAGTVVQATDSRLTQSTSIRRVMMLMGA